MLNLCFQEKRKDLTDYRDDSTFSFDPSKISVKQLDKSNKRRIDSRKGVLLSSYSRKKTRRRKRRGGMSGPEGGERSVSPSPKRLCTGPSSNLIDEKNDGNNNVSIAISTLHPSPCV